MNTVDFLRELHRQGVCVSVDGDELEVSAAEDVLSAELCERIARKKTELIETLKLLSEFSEGHARIQVLTRGFGERSEFAMSFAQQRLWFLQRLFPDNPFYNLSMTWRLKGPLDVDALRASMNGLVARHETLRTTFRMDGEMPLQVISPPVPVALGIRDLSVLPEDEREAVAQRYMKEQNLRPFDLSAGPLLRAQLLRLLGEDHVLQLTLHHIITDYWSRPVVRRDLGTLYQASCAGCAPSLDPLAVQYADFSVWQRQQLTGGVLSEQLDFWRLRLAGISELKLPTDRPRPVVLSFDGAREILILSPQLSAALRSLALREDATLYMVLLAVFNVLLRRYTHQDDLVVGTPIANRMQAELDDLIGCFVNNLVMRTDASGDPPFVELLARVRRMALDAYGHQDLPFEQLVEALDPQRDLSRNPLFQVLFSLRNPLDTQSSAMGADLKIRDFPGQWQTTRFDLEVQVWDGGDRLGVDFSYSTDLFDAETIRRMLAHYERLLEGVVADPQCRLSELPMLSEAERHRLLVEWNDTATDYGRNVCIHQLFEAQAARTPEAVAVAHGGATLSYGELNARANRLARHLIKLGVGPETLVGVCLERSPALLVGMLGILKAGGAYVPLDPNYPSARRAFMLADTQAPVLLTEEALVGQLPPYAGHILCLDRDWPTIAAEDDSNLPSRTTAKNLAYVIYTSGSTGEPKGILLPHATLVNLMAWHGRGGSDGRVAQFTSISFDVSLQETLHALLSGKSLHIVDDATRLQPDKLVAFLETHAITDLFVPNIVLEYLAQAVVQSKRKLPALAHVYQAGEALTITPAVRDFFDNHPTCRLHNHYGPAESHVVTAATLPTDRKRWPHRPDIGAPIFNTRIYILDRDLRPVPIGVTGELHIGGDGLARGYLNRPDLTAEKFLPDPFSTVPGMRLYKTGDLARYLPDGKIEFLGRLDDQIKIRGFRVEPGEIEAVLSEYPAVRQAVILTREEEPGNKHLIAYVVLADPTLGDMKPLRAFVRERLPNYMCPAAYVLLEELPLTPNGKIDHDALPPPDARAYTASVYEPPVGEIETTLAEVWAEVLRLEKVGRHDNFFDLGGHSLLATKVVLQIHERVGIDLPLLMFFQSPTVAALAERLSIEDQSTTSNDVGPTGKARFVIQKASDVIVDNKISPIDRILGDQLDIVKTWEGMRSTPQSLIVTCNESGSRPGLFWCLQANHELSQLAKHLGNDQPVHGMRSGHLVMTYTVENIGALARRYADEMIALQPNGPFLLGGNCQGGSIARAVALRLAELGRTVSMLILMEQSKFRAYDGPVALIFGRDSVCNPYRSTADPEEIEKSGYPASFKPVADPETVFRNAYPAGVTVDFINGAHGQFFVSPNIESLALVLQKLLCDLADREWVINHLNSQIDSPLNQILPWRRRNRLDPATRWNEIRDHLCKLSIKIPPPEDFNEGEYLNAYPDVAEACDRGKFGSGFEHYIKHGRDEKRRRFVRVG